VRSSSHKHAHLRESHEPQRPRLPQPEGHALRHAAREPRLGAGREAAPHLCACGGSCACVCVCVWVGGCVRNGPSRSAVQSFFFFFRVSEFSFFRVSLYRSLSLSVGRCVCVCVCVCVARLGARDRGEPVCVCVCMFGSGLGSVCVCASGRGGCPKWGAWVHRDAPEVGVREVWAPLTGAAVSRAARCRAVPIHFTPIFLRGSKLVSKGFKGSRV
jgi:hypothetical protein